MSETKSVASETDVPAGLDVVPMEPGTIIGSRDLQGTDGTTRTDRPGEILGTPAPRSGADAKRSADNKAKQAAKGDYVLSEVDRANREELPLLGGPVEDGWEAADKATAHTTDAATAKAEAKSIAQNATDPAIAKEAADTANQAA